MGRFTILLGGDFEPTPRARAQIAGSRLIAADSGMRHAEALGLEPELWTGDFDSAGPELAGRHMQVPRDIHPPAKDMTDGEIAIEAALERGARELVLAGAFGGARADHAFFHLAAGVELAERGIATLLTSGLQEGVPLLPGTQRFDYPAGTVFSVLAFSDLTGLTLSGARWPLKDRQIPFGSSFTLSNEVAEDGLSVGLGAGRALLVAQTGG